MPNPAQANHKRHRNGGRRAKSRRAFDKRAKQPRDYDYLYAPVGRDIREACADSTHRATLLQGVEQQNGTKDNVDERGGDDQAVNARGEHLYAGHLPDANGESRNNEISDRHGAAGRPTKDDEQNPDD